MADQLDRSSTRRSIPSLVHLTDRAFSDCCQPRLHPKVRCHAGDDCLWNSN